MKKYNVGDVVYWNDPPVCPSHGKIAGEKFRRF